MFINYRVFNKAYNSDQWKYKAHQSEIIKPSEDFGRHNQQHKVQSDIMYGHNEGNFIMELTNKFCRQERRRNCDDKRHYE